MACSARTVCTLEVSQDVCRTSEISKPSSLPPGQSFSSRLSFCRTIADINLLGCGKSTLLKAIDKREYPIPDHVDIYLLNEGAPPSDLGALEWVVREAENEMERLDKLAEQILEDDGPESPLLMDLYEVYFYEIEA